MPWYVRRRYFDEGDSGGGNVPANGNAPGQAVGPSGNVEDPNKPAGGEPPKPVTFTAEQQAEINRIVGQTRADERTKAQKAADEARVKAEKDATDAAAAKKGEFEPLYNSEKVAREKAETRVKELETQATNYATRINASISAETKDWPESVKKSDPGDKDVEARQAWVDSHRDLAKELQGTKRAPSMGFGGGSPGKGNNGSGGGEKDVTDSYIASRYAIPGKKD